MDKDKGMIELMQEIVDNGNNVEVKGNKDGDLVVMEVRKTIRGVYKRRESSDNILKVI